MDKEQAVKDYYEGLHERIQFTLYYTEDDMDFHVTSLDIFTQIHIPHPRKEPLYQPGPILLP